MRSKSIVSGYSRVGSRSWLFSLFGARLLKPVNNGVLDFTESNPGPYKGWKQFAHDTLNKHLLSAEMTHELTHELAHELTYEPYDWSVVSPLKGLHNFADICLPAVMFHANFRKAVDLREQAA